MPEYRSFTGIVRLRAILTVDEVLEVKQSDLSTLVFHYRILHFIWLFILPEISKSSRLTELFGIGNKVLVKHILEHF